MPVPLLCTNNTLGNYDYNIPIVANRSTDFRTSTGLYHRHLPELGQDFDCRVRARINPKALEKDLEIRDAINSTYKADYDIKYIDKGSENYAQPCNFVNNIFTRIVQEKVFQKPPPFKPPPLSEMKENYIRKEPIGVEREVFPPEPFNKCEIKGLGRDEQPAIRPELPGVWRWLDPYVSVSRSTHIPFTIEQWNGVARKDVMTYYDIAELPKAKGFGPRNGPAVKPLVPKRKLPMVDKQVFSKTAVMRQFPDFTPLVPNFGKTSEMKDKYIKQTRYELYPYTECHGVEMPEAIEGPSPFQIMPIPGMYCTEYMHYGKNWPVNCIVNYGSPPRYLTHQPCFTKVE